MASELQTSIDMGEPKVTMMDGFEKRCMHGSIQSAGTDDASSAQQMKFFKVAVNKFTITCSIRRWYYASTFRNKMWTSRCFTGQAN